MNMNDNADFLRLLKVRFAELSSGGSPKEFGIPKESLKEYRLARKKHGDQYVFDNEPQQKYRLYGEENKTVEQVDTGVDPDNEDVVEDMDAKNFKFENRSNTLARRKAA